MKVCDRCGVEYDERTVFIKEENAGEWAKRKFLYGDLCEDCDERYWSGEVNGFGSPH